MNDIERAYTQHAKDVYRYLLSLSHNEDLAEDLTQETFFRAMRTMSNYDGSCKLSVWLCQIAKHIWYQWLEKHSRFKQVEFSEDMRGADSPERSTLLRMEKTDLYKAIYEEMSIVILHEIPPEDKNIDFLKRLKEKIIHKNIMVTVLTCTIILCSFIIFAKHYELPLPFDTNRMFVELRPHVVTTNKDGRIVWKSFDPSNDGDDGQNDSGDVINVIEMHYRGISRISESSSGRNINRNGENVRVVYYGYAKTLWTSLFFDSDLADYSESGSSTGSIIYGDNYQSYDYKPQMIEIYYLPIRNLYKLDDLTDEEFDGLKEKSTLVWSGVN